MPTPTNLHDSDFHDCFDRPLTLERLDTLRTIERDAAASLGPHTLMARAGDATAAFIVSTLAAPAASAGKPVVWLFAGPGNNGGDALCAAASLRRRRVDAQVCLPVEPRSDDGRWALQQARDAGVPIHPTLPADVRWQDPTWMVDGLFGIGLNRAVSGDFAEIAKALSARTAAGGRVLALDVPSGLDSETGTVVGDGAAVEASHTLTFLAAKPGLFTGKGRDLTGEILVAPLGISPEQFRHSAQKTGSDAAPFEANASANPNANADIATGAHAAPIELNAPARFIPAFPRRRPSSHKGTFGSVAIVGGDTGTCGAAILAARAALYCGAGRVHTALVGPGGPAYDPPHPEIMMRQVDAIALDTMDALAIGPGLGKSDRAADILRQLLELDVSKLIDADALNLASTHGDIAERIRAHGQRIVITPHPAEAGRLLGIKTLEIEADRIHSARRLVDKFRCTVVLKGSGTIIASQDGRIAINASGNAGLSTGGTGDVLSGVIGAFLAQRVPPFEAALAATHVHGRAAEHLRAAGTGPAGLTAGELAPTMRALLNTLFRDFNLI